MGLEGWVKAFSTPGIIKAITNTFTLAITRQVIALFIGAFFAWLIARTDLPMKGLLEFFFWLSFFLPALPETMGWILLLDPKYGLLNQGLIGLGIVSQPLFNIYSFWGIVWAHMGGTVSIKVMLLAPAFRNLDAALEESSRISGASGWHTFFHILIPVMMPAILVTTILGIIRALEAFEIELLLGTPIGLQVYSTKIHELVTWEPPQFAPAMALSTVFLGLLLVMVAFQRRYIANRIYATVTGRGFSIRRTHLGRWRYPAFALVLSFALGDHGASNDSSSDRHVHEAIWLLQYCRTLDARQLAGDIERSSVVALAVEHLGHRSWLRCYRRAFLLFHCVRDREDALSRSLAARFPVVASVVNPGHSSGHGAFMDLSPNQNFSPYLRHDLSFDGRYGDKEHALRHSDD